MAGKYRLQVQRARPWYGQGRRGREGSLSLTAMTGQLEEERMELWILCLGKLRRNEKNALVEIL